MHAISGCNCVSSFSRTGKITTFQTLKNKLDDLTDIISALILGSPSAVTSIQYVFYLYDENKSCSSVHEL